MKNYTTDNDKIISEYNFLMRRNFGDLLREELENKHIYTKDLEYLTGLTHQSINSWMNAGSQPKLEYSCMLAAECGVDFTDVFAKAYNLTKEELKKRDIAKKNERRKAR